MGLYGSRWIPKKIFLELCEMCWNSQQLWYRKIPPKIHINHKCSACLKKDWKILQIKIIDLVDRPFKESCLFFKKTTNRICRGKWMPYTVTPKTTQCSWNFKKFCSRKSSSLLPLLRLFFFFSVKKSWAQKMASKKSHRVRKAVLPKAS